MQNSLHLNHKKQVYYNDYDAIAIFQQTLITIIIIWNYMDVAF
jgi:hypothetical protein